MPGHLAQKLILNMMSVLVPGQRGEQPARGKCSVRMSRDLRKTALWLGRGSCGEDRLREVRLDQYTLNACVETSH